MRLNQLQIPVLLTVLSTPSLIEEFPSCSACKKRLGNGRLVVIYRERDEIRAVIHRRGNDKCLEQYKTRLIEQYSSLTPNQVCIMLGISYPSYRKLAHGK